MNVYIEARDGQSRYKGVKHIYPTDDGAWLRIEFNEEGTEYRQIRTSEVRSYNVYAEDDEA